MALEDKGDKVDPMYRDHWEGKAKLWMDWMTPVAFWSLSVCTLSVLLISVHHDMCRCVYTLSECQVNLYSHISYYGEKNTLSQERKQNRKQAHGTVHQV